MKKNNDMNAKKVMRQKLQVKLNVNDVAASVAKAINALPIVTEEEADELQEAANGMLNQMSEKGCWLGMGFVRKADKDMSLMSAVHGNFSALAMMVAEAMEEDPTLEMVFLLALALKRSMGKNAETEEDEEEE